MRLKEFLKQNCWLLLLVLATIIHFAISLKLALYWYDTFNLGKYDLGNAVQVVHYTLQGKFFTYTDRFGAEISRLSNHADFILLLFVPFFAIFPSPVTLIVAQCLALSLGGLVVYLLCRKIGLSKAAAALLALAYLLNPDVGYLGLDAFHGITFAIPFVLLAFYFLERYIKSNQRQDLWGLTVSVFLVLIAKEEASLLVAALGLYTLVFRRKRSLGLILAAAGFSWFGAYFFLISPSFGPQRVESITNFSRDLPGLVPEGYQAAFRENPFISRYSHLGGSLKEVLLSPIFKPSEVLRSAFNWEYLKRLLVPVGFLPLFAPAPLLIVLPEYLINTLSSGAIMAQSHHGVFHYVSLLIPVVFYAAILGSKRIGWVLRGVFKSLRLDFSVLASFFVFAGALFLSFEKQNPVVVNPVSIASQRLVQLAEKHPILSSLPLFGKKLSSSELGKKLPSLEPAEPAAFMEEKSGTAAEDTLRTRIHRPIVYIQNPKHSGGNAAVYELLRKRSGAISGPSSLGAKLAVREDYNLFPIRWRESQFVVADLTGPPKSFRTATEGEDEISIAVSDFLRGAIFEVHDDPSYGLLHSGNGLVVFERGLDKRLFETLPSLELGEFDKPSRGVIIRDFELPSEIERGEAVTFELDWELEDGLTKEASEAMPFLTLARKGEQAASFYDAIYGLFLLLRDISTQRVSQSIKIPVEISPGIYKVCFGWYELIGTEMSGTPKLKDTLELGWIEIR